MTMDGSGRSTIPRAWTADRGQRSAVSGRVVDRPGQKALAERLNGTTQCRAPPAARGPRAPARATTGSTRSAARSPAGPRVPPDRLHTAPRAYDGSCPGGCRSRGPPPWRARSELSGVDHLVTDGPGRVPQQLLVGEGAVDLCAVSTSVGPQSRASRMDRSMSWGGEELEADAHARAGCGVVRCDGPGHGRTSTLRAVWSSITSCPFAVSSREPSVEDPARDIATWWLRLVPHCGSPAPH